MITTLDHISGGRAGLNIVAGAYAASSTRWAPGTTRLGHDERYDLTEEWTTMVKRLWASPASPTRAGSFTMKDCVSEPKPLSRPRPDLICAGMSDRGFRFAVREADACFIGGRTAGRAPRRQPPGQGDRRRAWARPSRPMPCAR